MQAYGIRKWAVDENGVERIWIESSDQFSQYLTDMEDTIDDGIILVGSANNNSQRMDIRTGNDYDNYMKFTSNIPFYYHRGFWITAI